MNLTVKCLIVKKFIEELQELCKKYSISMEAEYYENEEGEERIDIGIDDGFHPNFYFHKITDKGEIIK